MAFKEWASTDEKLLALETMRTLPERVPSIAEWSVGLNVGSDPVTDELSGGTISAGIFTGKPPRWFDFAMVADFACREDYETFIAHPAHIETRKNITARVTEEVYRVQFEL